jgi:hypothetical protein
MSLIPFNLNLYKLKRGISLKKISILIIFLLLLILYLSSCSKDELPNNPCLEPKEENIIKSTTDSIVTCENKSELGVLTNRLDYLQPKLIIKNDSIVNQHKRFIIGISTVMRLSIKNEYIDRTLKSLINSFEDGERERVLIVISIAEVIYFFFFYKFQFFFC